VSGHGAVPGSVLLFVCHANICRSPMAERLARHALTDRLGPAGAPITVVSAGTHAPVGEPMHPGASHALGELGADGNGFRSRPVSAELVTGANLVLAASRQERGHCVALSPSAMNRTFTIRQIGRLAAELEPRCLSDVPPARRWAVLLEELGAARGRLQPVPAEDDDLADPVDGTAEGFRTCAAEIQHALTAVLALIAPR
jgi:protein-tyrosine phosphatase